MASKPILRDRRMLRLLLPLPLFLTAREFVLTRSPTVFCALPVMVSRHGRVDRTEVPKHHHVLKFALTIFFGHVCISQYEAVSRTHCIAERFGSQICHGFLTLDSSHSQPLGSDFTLHAQVCHINVHQSTRYLSVDERCDQWPSYQWPTLASSRNPDPSTTKTLPMLQHTALLLRCFLQ